MILRKGNNQIELNNENHVAAFVSEGWVEVVEDEKSHSSATKPSSRKKQPTKK